MLKKIVLSCTLVLVASSCAPPAHISTQAKVVDRRVEHLLARMTLEERSVK